MEDNNNSWVRRVKFSHTIYHRIDSTKLSSYPLMRLASFPVARKLDRAIGVQIRSGSIMADEELGSHNIQVVHNPITNTQRSVSPSSKIPVSDAFKEARVDSKRFSSPLPRGKHDMIPKRKPLKIGAHDSEASDSMSSSSSGPLDDFCSVKSSDKIKSLDKLKSKKDFALTKYFDHGVGRVTAAEAMDEWAINLSKLFVGIRFACGAHSRLHHGIYKDKPVAVKIITLPDDDENGELSPLLEKQYNREVSLLSRLHHQNVLKLIGVSKNAPVYCIITEYLSGGSLRAYLHKLEQKSLPLQKLIKISLNVARGMAYIHSQGVIHRDLKPENILFDEDFQMKVADFGIACEELLCDFVGEDPGTFRWMAPEVIKRKAYGRKVDVYSFGLLLWEMVAGTIPYSDMTPVQAAFAVSNKNLRPVIPLHCSRILRAFIEQCWSVKPDKRPEFWQIIKVLEKFESSLAFDGTLNRVQNSVSLDHKKALHHWIQKLSPLNLDGSSLPLPKVRYAVPEFSIPSPKPRLL